MLDLILPVLALGLGGGDPSANAAVDAGFVAEPQNATGKFTTVTRDQAGPCGNQGQLGGRARV